MGWMSWGTFDCELRCHLVGFENCISAALFKSQAQVLEEEGYLEAGYNTIHVDDCWAESQRDPSTMKLVPNKTRFPEGMDGLSSYLHAKGIRLGLYTDIGVLTCGGFPGSRGYYDLDASTFASWGVDYIKVDGCYERTQSAYDKDYPALGAALRATGRPMQYNCGWPAYLGDNETAKPYPDIVSAGCTTWRNWHDIEDHWDRLLMIVNHWGEYGKYLAEAAAEQPGRYNDPDMLVVGMTGKTLTLDQQRLQLAVWSIVNAPLIMGNDLRRVSKESKDLLLNTEMIAINQDPLGVAGWRVSPPPGDDANANAHANANGAAKEVWVKPLHNENLAVALLNKLGEKEDKVEFNLKDIMHVHVEGEMKKIRMGKTKRGKAEEPQRGPALRRHQHHHDNNNNNNNKNDLKEGCAMVRDVFAKKDLGKKCGTVAVSVGPHGAALLRISPPPASST